MYAYFELPEDSLLILDQCWGLRYREGGAGGIDDQCGHHEDAIPRAKVQSAELPTKHVTISVE
ncbi:uncharacterized protein GLRG_06561 [Colletotrichum graminicola M1.001]|uniref:Uncharacterized protein n=1 Tax=Colletotrichum graminicola (strain M1.001 / M2 / FGSC 10212) TaxID=645133 RepID=E3QKM9_COLGM|nr:uncharacterized protein GLRG_06561 [Colletotrichum graminicola M1.001]EFQ31417.1 hypothetical protein GLRG_06561 [Colletotrichum graminicola M1.001]